MSNNLPQDMYNPPSSSAIDFEEFRFSEVPMDELFWLNTNANPNENNAHRKISEVEGLNTKTRLVSNFAKESVVYQKI
tara:strand:- start:5157 stop:5390 length:234 start_codon:yes stop_codon:yes gene_type:complete